MFSYVQAIFDASYYFEYAYRVFHKYRVSFRQYKCHFLIGRVEYVVRDLLADGNCPAKSKFKIIDNLKLPPGGSLYSFVGLVSFYHRYATYLEMRLKQLQLLIKTYFRTTIPMMVWTLDLIKLFEDIKICVTSSPVLARYVPIKPAFLKDILECRGDGLDYDAIHR